MEGQYMNREIDEKFVEVHKVLQAILDQTRKTNGRVNGLENWRWMMTGGLVVISLILTAVIIPLTLSFFNGGIEKIVSRGVEDKLSAYEVEIKN